MTDAERTVRERVRLQAVAGFEAGDRNREIAAELRVSERSVERWRRQWREEGLAGVASKGSPGWPRLSDIQIARLERELELAAGKCTAAVNNAWVVFEDEAGQSMTPPRARTWGRRGCTPVVRVRGRGSGRVSMAGMTCYKAGERSRLIYEIREYRGRKDEPKGFGWKDYRDLIVRAHTQLGGPIVLVWDNLRMRLVAPLREFFEANTAWLTVFQLPTYAPDLNPQEGVWSLVKRGIGNLAAADLGQVTRAVKRKLKMLQYRPEVIDGCLTATGLTLEADVPQFA